MGKNDNMVILAQDPSFAKLAFCLYDGNGTIFLDNCEFSLGECVGFEKIFQANRLILKQYLTKLTINYGVNNTIYINKIFSEIPPPNGTYAAGLFSLDTYILDKLFAFNKKCDEIWTIPPSFLMTVHNTRKYKKSESVTLAKYFINDVLKGKFVFKFKGAINADRAESFFFLLKAFAKYDIRGTRDMIINTISGFYSESEKLLISRNVEGV
jgi:hypothetical protein